MALPQVTRIVAPHLWGWLADRGGAPRARRATDGRRRHARLPRRVRRHAVRAALRDALRDDVLLERGAAAHGSDDAHASRRGDVALRTACACGVRSVSSSRWSASGYLLDVVAARRRAGARARDDARHARVRVRRAGGAGASHHEAERSIGRRAAQAAKWWRSSRAARSCRPRTGRTTRSIPFTSSGEGYSKAATGWLWALGVACEIAHLRVDAAALSGVHAAARF